MVGEDMSKSSNVTVATEIHPQATTYVRDKYGRLLLDAANVDEEMAPVIGLLSRWHVPTYESCQNYGEYLRSFTPGLDHIFECGRDYAYIEFYNWDNAVDLIAIFKALGPQHPLYHKVMNEGTPGAWELKARPSKPGHFQVWLPHEDLPAIAQVLQDGLMKEEN
jgi:hypothetical protein